MLEMMKEWKNNPGSDEESTADQKNKLSNQEKLEGYRLGRTSKNVQAVTSNSEEEDRKQVGRTNKTSRKNNVSFLQLCPFCCWFVMKALPDKASKVLV